MEFGYYGEFNVAKHAIENCGCAEKIEYSGVNKDLFLEEFHFKVTTRTGKVVRLWFDADNMDVNQVCFSPAGVSVLLPSSHRDRRYSLKMLSELLSAKGIQVRTLGDVLRNLDELESVLNTTDGDPEARREADNHVWDYLRIEFPTERELGDWDYTDVKTKDVENWP